jgi:acyl-lipid omega-6 desaturase (Delta-12 desaturase)
MGNAHDVIHATKPFARDFTVLSWVHVITTLLGLGASLCGALLLEPLWARVASSVLASLFLLRMFVIYHDQQHHAILARSRAAEMLMRVFGIYALSASSIWRSSHNHHHNHNSKLRGSHIGSFPIMTTAGFLKADRSAQRSYLMIRHPLTILMGYFTMFLLGMCALPFFRSPKKHFDCLVSLLVHIAIGVTLYKYWGIEGVLLGQTVPHFITYAIGSYLFYAQHNLPGVSFHEKDDWTYEKAALESSSYMKTGAIMRYFTANIGFHHVHHLNAKIPFYRLPEAMRAVPELANPVVTTLFPTDIVRCLRLKLWDVEAQRMVSLAEMRALQKQRMVSGAGATAAAEEPTSAAGMISQN